MIIGATFFWFMIDAAELAAEDPPFRSRYGFYQFFVPEIPVEVVSIGLVSVHVFLLCALISLWYLPVPQRMLRGLALRQDRLKGIWSDLFCLLVAAVGYVPLLISAQGDIWALVARLILMRSIEEGSPLYIDPGLYHHFLLFGLFGGAIATARLILASPGSLTLRLLAVAVTFFWVFLSGTRFQMSFLVMPAIILFVIERSRERAWRKTRIRILAFGLVIAVSLWMQAALRSSGGLEGYQQYEKVEEIFTGGSGGYDHFEAMVTAIDISERRGEYFKESMLPLVLTHFVPRAWWEGKPEWQSWNYYNDAVTRGGTLNVTPSVTGQYYMNWGLYGVAFIGLMFGWLARLCDEWLGHVTMRDYLISACLAGFVISFLFLSFRILSPVYMAYVIAAVILYLVSTKRVSRSY